LVRSTDYPVAGRSWYDDRVTFETDQELAARDRVRGRWASVLNIIAPGAGLIVLRQEGVGCILALSFAVAALTALWGTWIVPGVVDRSITTAAMVLAGGIWCVSQWLVRRRARLVLGLEAQRSVARCCESAAEAAQAGCWDVAEARLREALTINDELAETQAQWARLVTLRGRFDEARSAWEAVLDLDEAGTLRREAIVALERLPSPHGSE